MTEEKNTGAPEQEMDLSEQRLIRRAKLKELQDAGEDPFQITKYVVTARSADVKEKFEQALEQGSQEEMVIHEFCDRMQIPFEKISSEDFSAFLRILSLSKMLKNPNNMRGKAKAYPEHPQRYRKK